MNEIVSNKTKDTEFDKLLAESINKSNLKEGSIIEGTISEIVPCMMDPSLRLDLFIDSANSLSNSVS